MSKTVCAVLQVKLVDAGFVWTEPHSRRIKVKLTVQAEVMNGAILQQTFVVEYVVEPHMCMDCTRANTNTSIWTACAQVLRGHLLVLQSWRRAFHARLQGRAPACAGCECRSMPAAESAALEPIPGMACLTHFA